MTEAEQKARANGILSCITSFKFVATLYFLSDVMPQLSIFFKTLQYVDINVEGVLHAYDLIRTILTRYQAGIDSMSFTKRFVAALQQSVLCHVIFLSLYPICER